MVQLDELDEWRPKPYEKSRTFKEVTKQLHGAHVKRINQFKVEDKVLVDKSDPRMILAELKSRGSNPIVVLNVLSYGTIEVTCPEYNTFKVNGNQLKLYFGGDIDNERKELQLQDPL
ncbi:hypothetical protein GOBAR_DD09340 [Gossypium barbadense]|nr:hypothetical protein GOBAR_DD09340 [Gossypium barbadense]